MTTNFYEVTKKLDQLKKRESISQVEILEALEYLGEEKFARYFFMDLENPAWVLPLHENKFFLRVPSPLEVPNNPGYISMPAWYAGEYLKRMADKFPNTVKEVALSLETHNSRAFHTILEALLRVPVTITAETVSKFKSWIETPFSNFMMLARELGLIMEYLAKGGEINAALLTLSVLLDPIQLKDRLDEGKLVASTLHDFYWLSQALKLNLPVITKVAPASVVDIAEAQLIKAIELEHDPKVDDNEKKFYSYWRLSISPLSDVNYDNEIKNLLVDTIITALNTACELSVEDANTILNRYINSEYSVFRRIGNYVLRFWGQKYPDLLVKTYMRHKESSIKGGESEFDKLIELQFKNLPPSMQNEIIRERMTPDIQRIEELLKNNPERFVGETTEEKRQTIIERWQLEELAPLALQLEGETKEYYDVLQNKYGKPAIRPESGVEITSWEGPESPIAIEELGKKSIEEVVDYLLTYVPTSEESFGAPSKGGLARTLELDVQSRANDYASNIALFIKGDLPFVYHTHLLRGLENASKNQVKFALAEVATLCEFITKQDKDKFKKEAFEEGLPAAKLATVNFLGQLFREKDSYIENDLSERFAQIVTNLLQQDEPFPYDENAQGFDPATYSLNCVHGIAMHSLILYALYCERKRKKEADDKGEPIMVPLVKETLTQQLDKTKNQSLAIHAIFGWYFPQFVHLDKEWALKNRERIFPFSTDMTKYWLAAWSSYIRFSDVYTNVFPELISQYQKALEEFPILQKSPRADRSDEKMATHILKAYLLDMIQLDSQDGLLRLYYQKADDETRSHGNFWLGQVLNSQQPSAENVTWKKVWDLWQWRVEEAAQSNNKDNYSKEITNFTRLLEHCPLDLNELNSIIEQTLTFSLNGFEAGKVMNYLSKNAEKYPSLSISNLQKILLSSQEFYILDDTKKSIEQILTSALNADSASKTKAIEIINLLGERGDYSWRPLLDIVK